MGFSFRTALTRRRLRPHGRSRVHLLLFGLALSTAAALLVLCLQNFNEIHDRRDRLKKDLVKLSSLITAAREQIVECSHVLSLLLDSDEKVVKPPPIGPLKASLQQLVDLSGNEGIPVSRAEIRIAILGYENLLEKVSGERSSTAPTGDEQKELLRDFRFALEQFSILKHEVDRINSELVMKLSARSETLSIDSYEKVTSVIALSSAVLFGLFSLCTLVIWLQTKPMRIRSADMSSLSHDVRDALNGILGLASMGLAEQPSTKVRESLIGIKEEAEKLLGSLETTSTTASRSAINSSKFSPKKGLRSPSPKVASVSPESMAPISPNSVPDRNCKILLAEDNIVNQKIAVRLLENRGFKVRTVPNGLEALTALRSDVFDLILMDIQMPQMDGLEATQQIRKSRQPFAKVPIIALTANALDGDREKYLSAGMNDYVAKPLDPKLLIERIEAVLESKG